MADKGNANKTSSILFTLPISCQICLGKVKQPVVCPNQHVFCSVCMELWMQHNQQCPACRIPITPENPCKQVHGGPNFSEDAAESSLASTPILRRTRLDLLYKEYEDEIERLNNEVDTLKTRNHAVQSQLSKQVEQRVSSPSPCGKGMKPNCKDVKDDKDVLLILTTKLNEATSTYEKVKHDMGKMKEVNLRLRDENASLLRETGRLKQLVATRSPHKYEKYAISAQETRIEQCEKEIKQLKKALDRSDLYVEELESKNAAYQAKYGEIQIDEMTNATSSAVSNVELSRSVLETSELSGFCAAALASVKVDLGSKSTVKQTKNLENDVRVKEDLVDGCVETESESTFQLEQPSPITPASSLRRLTLESNTKTYFNNSPSTSTASSTASSLRSCTRQLDFDVQNQVNISQVCDKSQQDPTLNILDFDNNDAMCTPSISNTTLGNLDYSITPEFEACTKLLNAAEERVHQRKQNRLEEKVSPETLLEFQPSTAQHSTTYTLSGCHPTFQLNPVLVSQASTTPSDFSYETPSQRPPTAPAASNINNTDSGQLFSQSVLPSPKLSNSAQSTSAPLVGTQGSSIQMIKYHQSQVHPTSESTPLALSLSNNSVQVLNSSRNIAHLPPHSSTSVPMTLQFNSPAVPSNAHTPLLEFIQSQSNQETPGRPKRVPKQQKTVYVLSGSRIAPLGERRKRNSSSERSEQNVSNNISSPAKTQKF